MWSDNSYVVPDIFFGKFALYQFVYLQFGSDDLLFTRHILTRFVIRRIVLDEFSSYDQMPKFISNMLCSEDLYKTWNLYSFIKVFVFLQHWTYFYTLGYRLELHANINNRNDMNVTKEYNKVVDA